MKALKQREALLALSIVALTLLVGLRAPVFLTVPSLANLLTDSTLLIMLALAQMLVIVTRGVDLSVASNLALSGMAAALLASRNPDLPLIVVVLAATLLGLVLGLILSSLMFGMGHLYQGVGIALGTALSGAALALLYLRRRSAIEPIAAHAISDVFAVLAATFLAHPHG